MKLWQFIIVAIILLLAFIGGCVYHKETHPPKIPISNSVFIHDTIPHNIPNYYPWYIIGKDSISYIHDTIPGKVDIAAILKDYFAIHYYTRQWIDSLLSVTLEDAISENKSINNSFSYKILRPQAIITNVDNSINYDKYLYLSLGSIVNDLKYTDISLSYASGKTLIGLGYLPLQKTLSFKIGVNIAKFR
jgi:hypothetical protein